MIFIYLAILTVVFSSGFAVGCWIKKKQASLAAEAFGGAIANKQVMYLDGVNYCVYRCRGMSGMIEHHMQAYDSERRHWELIGRFTPSQSEVK